MPWGICLPRAGRPPRPRARPSLKAGKTSSPHDWRNSPSPSPRDGRSTLSSRCVGPARRSGARDIPPGALRARLGALRQVFDEQLPADLAPLAKGYVDRALAEFDGEPAGLNRRLTAETPAERLAATYLLAILEGDRRKALGLILQAADMGENRSGPVSQGPSACPGRTGPDVAPGRSQRGGRAFCHDHDPCGHGPAPRGRPAKRRTARP